MIDAKLVYTDRRMLDWFQIQLATEKIAEVFGEICLEHMNDPSRSFRELVGQTMTDGGAAPMVNCEECGGEGSFDTASDDRVVCRCCGGEGLV